MSLLFAILRHKSSLFFGVSPRSDRQYGTKTDQLHNSGLSEIVEVQIPRPSGIGQQPLAPLT